MHVPGGYSRVVLTGRKGVPVEVGPFGELQAESLRDYVSCHFAYGIDSQEVSTAVTGDGAVTSTDSMVICTANTGTARVESRLKLRYRPGHGMLGGGTLKVAGDGYGYFRLGDAEDGFTFYAKANGDYKVSRMFAGAEVFAASDGTGDEAINGESLSGFDFAKLNIIRITAGYYGVADIAIEIKSRRTQQWTLVHVFNTAGNLTKPHISKPYLPVTVGAETGTVAASASFEAGTWGGSMDIGGRSFSWHDTLPISGDQANAVITTFRSATTFGGKTNYIRSKLLRIEFYIDATANSTGTALFDIRRVVSMGGSPSWAPVDARSVMEVDTAGTPVLGNSVYPSFLGYSSKGTVSQATSINADAYGLYAYPGEMFAITCSELSGNAIVARIALNYVDEF